MNEKTVYNKLVRDKIGDHLSRQPDIVGFEMRACENDRELAVRLNNKLLEEVNEFIENPCAEEAGDLLEVIHALLRYHEITQFEVDDARFHKAAQKGRFNDGLVLDWVRRK